MSLNILILASNNLFNVKSNLAIIKTMFHKPKNNLRQRFTQLRKMRLLSKKAITRVLPKLASLDFTIYENTRAFKLRPEHSK